MTTTQSPQAKAQHMLEQVRAGRTVFTKAPDGTWMIVGPVADIQPGLYVTVTKADGTETRVQVQYLGVRDEKQGVAYQVATFTRIRTIAEQEREVRANCRHTDRDNNGRCYGCGHYSRGADVGRVVQL